jgi:hypothetical protein
LINASRSRLAGFEASRVVDAFVFAAEVVAPVGVEVAAGGEGAELEDGLGSFQSHLAPVMSILSLTMWRHAPSMTRWRWASLL